MDKLPLPLIKKEKFNVQIFEEGAVVNFDIVFSEDAIMKWDDDPSNMRPLYEYDEVMPDKDNN